MDADAYMDYYWNVEVPSEAVLMDNGNNYDNSSVVPVDPATIFAGVFDVLIFIVIALIIIWIISYLIDRHKYHTAGKFDISFFSFALTFLCIFRLVCAYALGQSLTVWLTLLFLSVGYCFYWINQE